ncbi:MAG: hypothetical protein Q4B95_08145 [Lonepinella koalarum]|nr:hypothetical protein [Lonepinella koalarum]
MMATSSGRIMSLLEDVQNKTDMTKLSKITLKKIYDLETILSYLNPDIISDQVYNELTNLSFYEYDKIIDIAYKTAFENLDDINKKSFSQIINQSLNELSNEDIDYVFQSTTYFPIDDSENYQFVRNLLLKIKDRFDWI